jgi:phenylacetate-CoA ligase
VRSSIAEQAEWLQREKPEMLQTYPSVLFEIARHFLENDRPLPSLKRVYTFGEVLEPKVRELCRQAWGVDVLDSYSTTEVGYVASQCDQGSYHVHAEHLLVEVLDDDGLECAPGETGRVVITDLFNYAMPLLRYEIGDYAEVGHPCPCGRKLPTLRRVLGRQRNMLVLPNGEKRWPVWEMDVLEAFDGRLPVRQYQAIQRSRNEIELKLVATHPLSADEESKIRRLFGVLLDEGMQVHFNYVDSIPRGPNGKFEDFRCELVDDA